MSNSTPRKCQGCIPMIKILEDMKLVKGIAVYIVAPCAVTLFGGIIALLFGVKF